MLFHLIWCSSEYHCHYHCFEKPGETDWENLNWIQVLYFTQKSHFMFILALSQAFMPHINIEFKWWKEESLSVASASPVEKRATYRSIQKFWSEIVSKCFKFLNLHIFLGMWTLIGVSLLCAWCSTGWLMGSRKIPNLTMWFYNQENHCYSFTKFTVC